MDNGFICFFDFDQAYAYHYIEYTIGDGTADYPYVIDTSSQI